MEMLRSAVEGPVISGFSAGGFKVGGGVYHGLLISPLRADGWTPPPIEQLSEADLSSVLTIDPTPEFVILGTGSALVHPPRPLVAALAARNIGLEIMDSRAAARAWGVLRAEKRWIIGALYPL